MKLFNLKRGLCHIGYPFFIISLFFSPIVVNFQIISSQNQTQPITIPEQDDECVKIGHFQFSNFKEIIVAGNIAYILSEDTGLFIYDITNKLEPQLLYREHFLGYYWDFAKAGDLLYIINTPIDSYVQLTIYNVSTPSNPKIISTFPFYSVRDIVAFDQYIIITTNSGFSVYNLSDPYDLDFLDLISISSLNDVYISGDLVFFSSSIHECIYIYNISTPNHPQLVSQYTGYDLPFTTLFSPTSITISNYFLFLVDLYAGLIIIDISDPEDLSYSYQVELEFQSPIRTCMQVLDDYLYISDETNGLFIIEDIKGSQPRFFDHYSGNANYFLAIESYLCISNGAFLILDVHEPSNIQLLSRTGIESYNNSIKDIAIANNFAYCAILYGLLILDISNLSNPEKIYYTNNYSSVRTVELFGNYLFVGSFGKLIVLDISNPFSPFEIDSFSSFEINGEVSEFYVIDTIFIQDTFAFITYFSSNFNDIFLILDISNPLNPIGMSEYNFGHDHIVFLFCSGNYVYKNKAFIGHKEILYIFDVRNKANPKIVSTYTFVDIVTVHDIVVVSDYAFIGSYDSYSILNVQKPTNVRLLNHGNNSSHTITIGGKYACFAQESLILYDMFDPKIPVFITTYNDTETTIGLNPDSSSYIEKIILHDNSALLAYGENGFVIIGLPITVAGTIPPPIHTYYFFFFFGLLIFIPIIIIIIRKKKSNKENKL